MGYDLLSLPCVGYGDRASVAANVIVLSGHFGRIVREMSTPGKTDVEIYRVAIAVQFPDARHAHFLPAAIVVAGEEEVVRTLVGMFVPSEFPLSVQREESL